MSSVLTEKCKCDYTKQFCEENVWKLCKFIEEHAGVEALDGVYVIFVSNPERTVPIWKQQSSDREDTMVVWDYHVILYSTYERSIYDLDSILPFPCPVDQYLMEGLKPNLLFKPKYKPFLRVVAASVFLQVFASNRSHMKREDGSWLAPPPDYPPISTQSASNNLQKFICMTEKLDSEQYGVVVDLDQFRERFTRS